MQQYVDWFNKYFDDGFIIQDLLQEACYCGDRDFEGAVCQVLVVVGMGQVCCLPYSRPDLSVTVRQL